MLSLLLAPALDLISKMHFFNIPFFKCAFHGSIIKINIQDRHPVAIQCQGCGITSALPLHKGNINHLLSRHPQDLQGKLPPRRVCKEEPLIFPLLTPEKQRLPSSFICPRFLLYGSWLNAGPTRPGRASNRKWNGPETRRDLSPSFL